MNSPLLRNATVVLLTAALFGGPIVLADESEKSAPPPAEAPVGEETPAEDSDAGETANEIEEGASEEVEAPTDTSHLLLGDAFGLRRALEEMGITVDASFVADVMRTQRGGVNPHNTERHEFLTIALTLDGETALGLRGWWFTADFWRLSGDQATNHAGTWQNPSGYFGPDRQQWGQVYADWIAEDHPLRLRLGKWDPTWEFGVVDRGDNFLLGDATWAPTLIGVPVYPDPSVGIGLHWEPEEGLYARAAWMDGSKLRGERTGMQTGDTFLGGHSDSVLLGEVGFRAANGPLGKPARVGFGAWRHNGRFTRLDQPAPATRNGAGGVYATADFDLWNPDEAGDAEGDSEEEPSGRGLALFLKWSSANGSVSDVTRHGGGGLVWTGPFQSRPDDSIGLGLFRSTLNGGAFAGYTAHHEWSGELYWRMQVTPWLALTPAVQVFRNPGGDRHVPTATVLGLRLAVDF
jgi:carbohydrate-selective porin OprB